MIDICNIWLCSIEWNIWDDSLNSLILDFQNDINNPDMKIGDILRKALLIATKLNITDFVDWINLELEGYGEKNIPDYRIIKCDIRLNNAHWKNLPFIINDTEIYETIQTSHVRNSIIEVEGISYWEDSIVKLIPPIETRNLIYKYFPTTATYEISLLSNTSQYKAIVDAVRTKLLKWSLELEKDGIIGRNLSFNDEELEIANKNESYKFIITNSNVQFGDNNTQIVNNFKNISLEMVNLKNIINGSDLESNVEINNEIKVIDDELKNNVPDIKIIKKSLHFLEDIFKGIISNIIAQQALFTILQILVYITANF